MIKYSMREWEFIRIGDGEGEMSRGHAQRMVSIASRSPLAGADGTGVLSLSRDSVHAGQVVGVVAHSACSVEILPKIEGLTDRSLRHQLVHMLAVAFDLPINYGELTTLESQNLTLLELIIRSFAERLAEVARSGIPRDYVSHQDDLPALRGRLDVMRQYTTLVFSPTRVASRYHEFSADMPLNQIMKAAIDLLLRLSRYAETRRRLFELSLSYEGVSSIPTSSLPWSLVKVDRTNQQWAGLLEFARLLIARHYQSSMLGDLSGYALLFEMNVLFEKYVERMLTRGLRPLGYSVTGQGGGLYCLMDRRTGMQAFRTRPDLIVRKDGRVVMILDTKWKHVGASDDTKNGIVQGDVYQMMAYAQIYQCANLALLYPWSRRLGQPEGEFCSYRITGGSAIMFGFAIDISNHVGFAARIADLVVEAIACQSAALA